MPVAGLKHSIDFSHADKIFFPKTRITKGDVVDYYADVADLFIAHAYNHPIAMQRFPDGIRAGGFYHKDVPDYFPDWIGRAPIRRRADRKVTVYPLCNDRDTLIYLANQGVLTFHQWQSSVGSLENPDRLVFDLDPGRGVAFGDIKKTALWLKDALESYGLAAFVMTTGAHGLHVVVPLKPVVAFPQVFEFACYVADVLVVKHPRLLTRQVRKQERVSKIFIDVLRNRWAQLAVVPYSIRPLEGAPIATPLAWEELLLRGLNPQTFTIRNIRARLDKHGDAWGNMRTYAHTIPTSLGQP